MDELIGLTPEDESLIARIVAWFLGGRDLRGPRQSKEPLPKIYEVVPFINASGEEIPAYAVMRLTTPTTVDGEMIVNVAKPDATYRWRYLINGPEVVSSASDARGWGTYAFDGDKILYASGTPAVGERWGPTVGQWYLTQHRPGFIVNGCCNATDLWLSAQQAIPGEVRVKNDDGNGNLAGGSSRTFGIYGGASGTTDTGLEVTLTNSSSSAWAANKYGFATADTGGVVFGAPHEI